MANDDHSGDGGGGTWDASRSVDDVAEAHRTGGTPALGPSSPPGDIGPFANRKVGHFTQTDAGTPPVPTRVGATSLVEFEAGRSPPLLPPQVSAPRERVTVQRRAASQAGPGNHLDWASGGPLPETQVHAHAAEGIAGPGAPVPYRAELARSLGPQAAPMLDRISVHQDKKAQASSAAIGATAFAAGDHIALPAAPSLHLVAHEVAHVAQQAEGVHLSGGVGHEADPYEREADAFADAVVAGEPVSAAGFAGHGGSPRVVQRRASSAAHEAGGAGHPGANPASSSGEPAHDDGNSSTGSDAAAGLGDMEPWQLVAEVGAPLSTPERGAAIARELRERMQKLLKHATEAVAGVTRVKEQADGLAEVLQLDELMKPIATIQGEVLGSTSASVNSADRGVLTSFAHWVADVSSRWTQSHAALKHYLLEHHLWEVAFGGASVPSPGDEQRAGMLVNAAGYLSANATALVHSVAHYLAAIPWPPLHPRLAWRDAHAFVDAIAGQLSGAFGDLSQDRLPILTGVLAPANPMQLVDEMRPIVGATAHLGGNSLLGGAIGPSTWQPAIGVALAQIAHTSVLDSARRLATRWVAVADGNPAARHLVNAPDSIVTLEQLVTSHPMDEVVARALTQHPVVQYAPPVGDEKPLPPDKIPGRRTVTVAWQAGKLWNWVKADPPDATAEEVSAALYKDDFDRGQSFHAHRLVSAPPYFGVPEELARTFKDARPPEDAGLAAQVLVAATGPRAPEMLDAAGGDVGAEIALNQASPLPAGSPDGKPPAPPVRRAVDVIGESRTDLVFLAMVLAGWGMAGATTIALEFLESRSADLMTGGEPMATKWLPVLEGQRGHLAELIRLVHEVDAASRKLGIADPRDPRAAPLHEVMDVLAQAAGASHFQQSCPALIAKAGRLLENLTLEALRGTMRTAAASVDQARGAAREDHTSHALATSLDTVNVDAERLQAQMAAGAAVDPDEFDEVTLRAEEIGLDAKLHGLQVQLAELEHAMEVSGFFEWAASKASDSFLPTARAIPGLRGQVMDAQALLHPDAPGAATVTGGAENASASRRHRRRAVSQAQAELGALQAKQDLAEFLREGASLVFWQQVRTACVKTAAMIGIGIVAGAAAATVGKGVTGLLAGGEGTAEALAGLSMTGRTAVGAASVVADATVNTLGMTAMGAIDRPRPAPKDGEKDKDTEDSLLATLGNNVLFSAANKLVVEQLAKDMAPVELAEAESVTRWLRVNPKSRSWAIEVAAVPAHAVLGAAMMFATHRFGTHAGDPPPSTIQEWLLQGASIAIGRRIGHAAAARAERLASTKLPKNLAVESRQIAAAAHALEHATKPPATEEVLDLMLREQEALAKEAEAFEELRNDPAKLAASGLHWEDVAAAGPMHAPLTGEAAVAAAALPFHRAGLEEAVPGALWRGTHEQAAHAIEQARRLKLEITESYDPDGHRWQLDVAGSKVTIIEHAVEQEAAPAARASGHEDEANGHSDARTGHPTDDHGAKPLPERVVLAGDDAYLQAAAARAKPLPGYIDVVVHAEVDYFEVARSHETVKVDHRALATYLRKHGLEGQKIRLIACLSGKHAKAVAQHLANQLQVEVLAPNDTAWIDQHGTVGVGAADRHTGGWVAFEPKVSSARSTPADPLAAERNERFALDGPTEVEPPAQVYEARVDRRVKASSESLEALAARMGVKVTIDESMENGVSAKVDRRPGLVVDDLIVREIRIGRETTLADLVAHREYIDQVQAYNGTLGALKHLAERFSNWLLGRPKPQFPHGSRAWVTELELTKLRSLVEGRMALGAGDIDRASLQAEIAFLQGRVAFHEETLRSLEEAPGQFELESPDIGRVTREAEAKGYRLPGEAEGVDPKWYYYRHKQSAPAEFELARKASAPADAPPLRARVLAGEFKGIERSEDVGGATIPADWSKEQVVEHLRQTVGFAEYAIMLEAHGLASREVIDGVVAHKYGLRQTKGTRVTTDDVRHDTKEFFRQRVVEKLLDPALDDAASYAQMREMTKDLPPSDKGSLTEAWHIGRKMPDAQTHVAAMVERSDGENAGQIEKRFIDAVDGTKAVEVKSGAGPIDEGQLGAYLDMLKGNLREGSKVAAVDKLEYVFTDPAGAKENMALFADYLDAEYLQGRLSVVVYDAQGAKIVIRTGDAARTYLARDL